VFDYRDEGKVRGWKSVHVTDNGTDKSGAAEHPYMNKWWVPGLAIGYDASFTHQVADFITGLETGVPEGPTFRDALETQAVLDAVLDSARAGKWVEVANG
jgi:predicted dehydrogenase